VGEAITLSLLLLAISVLVLVVLRGPLARCAAVTLHAQVRTRLGSLHLDCDLSVESDVTVAVLGPNGAGKTTLLRIVAGLIPVDEGRVEVDGTVFEDTATRTWLTPEARRVGFVFPEPRPVPPPERPRQRRVRPARTRCGSSDRPRTCERMA